MYLDYTILFYHYYPTSRFYASVSMKFIFFTYSISVYFHFVSLYFFPFICSYGTRLCKMKWILDSISLLSEHTLQKLRMSERIIVQCSTLIFHHCEELFLCKTVISHNTSYYINLIATFCCEFSQIYASESMKEVLPQPLFPFSLFFLFVCKFKFGKFF